MSGVRLVHVDPDLGRDLEDVAMVEARRVIVLPAVELGPGTWEVADLGTRSDIRGALLGLLLIEGSVVADLRLGTRVCSRLFVGGDLLLFEGAASESLPVVVGWSAEDACRALVLDDRILAAGARWPRITGRLYRRAAQQV